MQDEEGSAASGVRHGSEHSGCRFPPKRHQEDGLRTAPAPTASCWTMLCDFMIGAGLGICRLVHWKSATEVRAIGGSGGGLLSVASLIPAALAAWNLPAAECMVNDDKACVRCLSRETFSFVAPSRHIEAFPQ